MAFSKEEIKAAKQGEHSVPWPLEGRVDRVRVARVQGEFVHVEVLDGPKKGQTYKINRTVSDLLVRGTYRA